MADSSLSIEEFGERAEAIVLEYTQTVDKAATTFRLEMHEALRRLLGRDLSIDPVPAKAVRDY